jgi:RNA polymerase sigma factor (sigma-70 family)
VAEDRRTDITLPGLWTGASGTVISEAVEDVPPSQRAGLHEPLVMLGPAVRGLVRHVLGAISADADVDDCAAETFRRALEYRNRLERGAPLRPWVLGIARNVALDARRARRLALARSHQDRSRDSSGDRTDSAADADQPALDRIADGKPGPEHQMELAERANRLQAALDRLPDDQRRALLLHAEGYGYREIGERLSAPLGTICTWISRARQGLARALTSDEAKDAKDAPHENQ